MSGSSRHRPALVPCLVALALLLAMALLPVLTSLGELHDLSHAPFGAHAHAGLEAGHDGDPPTQPELGEEGSGGFHALLHSAHCAGHAAQVALGAFPRLTALPPGSAHPQDETPLLPASPARAPYRPPIFA
ncbi:hypothetical protein [Azotobacter chroococcum]|uniref:hypothetical protein n=1 Tax=Azotobacter chroococcum TaxID=353 RepID=UPI000B5E064F|nr:hypothetical protein [Azotobacter chroococcum]ASL27829.1 hypothetical protein ACG10_17080 [Azotobacter chroococcum]TKD38271.1 hypothetical protein FCG41_14455 [Azotobacter chroococcum]